MEKIQSVPNNKTFLVFEKNSRVSNMREFEFTMTVPQWRTFFTFGKNERNFNIADGIVYGSVKVKGGNGDNNIPFRIFPFNLFESNDSNKNGWIFEFNKFENHLTYVFKFYAVRFDIKNNGVDYKWPNKD